MTADQEPLSDRELDALFDTVQGRIVDLPPKLTTAVLADAMDIAAEHRPVPPATTTRSSGPGWVVSFLNSIGGWQGATAVFASGLFGLWIGYSNQTSLPLVGGLGTRFDQMLSGAADLDPISTFDSFTLDG